MEEKIISLMEKKGPLVPTDITSELGVDSMIVSAKLSDMVRKKKINISHLKFGSSPLYFLPKHKEKLEQYISNLNEKDKNAFDLLKSKGVVRDSDLTPVQRVSMKSIKDFAIPLEVTFNDRKEIFWKFYSFSNEDASSKIKEIVYGSKQETEQHNQQEKGKESEKLNMEKEEAKQEEKQEIKEDRTSSDAETSQPQSKTHQVKKEPHSSQGNKEKSSQETLKKEKKDTKTDDFLHTVTDFLQEKNISILESNIVKKNSEIDLTIEVPSNLGNFRFFCKAKNKKRLNENDLSSTFGAGELKGLNSILLSPGDMTKKAKNSLETQYKKIKFVKI